MKNSEDKCCEFYAFGLGYIEAITFAIDHISNDTNLLPNVTLGFDIRDYCDTPVLAMETANDFVKSNYLNDSFEGQTDAVFRRKLKIHLDNLTVPISTVIRTEDSSSSTQVSSLLQVTGIPTIHPFAASEELSSPNYNPFICTILPDREQAKAMVDITGGRVDVHRSRRYRPFVRSIWVTRFRKYVKIQTCSSKAASIVS